MADELRQRLEPAVKPEPTVRQAEMRDAAVLADLVRLAFSTQSQPTTPPPGALKETAASIAKHLGHGGGAVAEDGGTILGAIFWNEEDGGLPR